MEDRRIRPAVDGDAAALAAIYAPVVRDTAISFETVPPTADEFRERMRALRGFAPWLVLEEGGRVAGYAYAGPFRARPAYRFTVESTVYVDAEARGRGVGRALYAALLGRLERQGLREVVAGITLPNPASVRLHESAGFEPVGAFRRVGWKAGRWHDVGFWQRALGGGAGEPAEPRPPE